MKDKSAIIILFLLSYSLLFSQKKDVAKYVLSQRISSDYELVFLKYNKDYNLYSNPRILYIKAN